MKKYILGFSLPLMCLVTVNLDSGIRLKTGDVFIQQTNGYSPKCNQDLPQRLSLAKVTFSDRKVYYANVVELDDSQVTLKLVNGDAEYTISKRGIILNSGGKYAEGSRVQSVMIKTAGESIYDDINQDNFNYGTVGLEFPDGKIQYGNANTIQVSFLSITMLHSKFNYYAYYKNGEWTIDMQGGEYSNGTVIKDIFELDQKFHRFY